MQSKKYVQYTVLQKINQRKIYRKYMKKWKKKL